MMLFAIITGLLLPIVVFHEASAAQVYDGSKGVLTFAFGHAYSSEKPAIQNITNYGFSGNISPVEIKIGNPDYLSQTELLNYKNAGWDILAHSMTHIKIDNTTPNSVLQYEIVQSKNSLKNMGFCVTGYESPYDVITTNSSIYIKNNYNFAVINPNKQNTVYSITHDGSNWNFPLAVHYSGVGNSNPIHDFATAKTAIDYTISNHTYLILNFHQIDTTTNSYATPPSLFWQILQYVKQKSDAGQLVVENSAKALGISCQSTSLSVSSSPVANSTYYSPQIVTLTASRPSTIYYTTDGSTPTTSSINGPTPLTGITVNTNSTLKFFAKDSQGNVSPIKTSKYTIILPVEFVMNDIVPSLGWNTYSGFRSIQAEYVFGPSSLVGESIDTIVLNLRKTGSPTGFAQVGIFNSDQSVKQLFGTMNVNSITSSVFTQYSFSLPAPQTYQIQSGDRIGIKFTGGNSSNFITIMTDQTNSFDGINSYHTWYTTGWDISKIHDLWMILKSHAYYGDPTVSALPLGGTYNSPQIVTLTASSPSTIYYTTDGSTPTTSSSSGPSPLSISIVSTTTLNFFAKDVSNDIGPLVSLTYTINPSVITQMNDTVATYGISAYSGRPVEAEYASLTSSLVGKSIDNILVQLRKEGNPTGVVQVGVFNDDLSVKQLFGSVDTSSLTTSYKQFSVSLPTPQKYAIQAGDRIGIKFAGGNSTNFVAIMSDQVNNFDGINSYLTDYTTTWRSFTGKDLTMTLKLHT